MLNVKQPTTNDWRLWRRYFANYADTVYTDRPNGIGAIPILTYSPLADDTLAESNFRVAEQTIPNANSIRIRHWTYAYYSVLVFPLTKESVTEAMDTQYALQDYPILDESDFSELELEQAMEWWESSGQNDVLSELVEHKSEYYETLPEMLKEAILSATAETYFTNGYDINYAETELAATELERLLDQTRAYELHLDRLNVVRSKFDHKYYIRLEPIMGQQQLPVTD